VVEKEGTIRVVQGGTLLSTPFLDLSGAVATGGERGLLSLAFPPGAIESGRFFVTFVNTDGHTVVSRFHRSTGDPLVADPATRFDLRWSTGERFISHPEALHYGGNLVFGADGYLYIGTGDGGEPNDASHQAQDLTKLHGKMLRINVNIDDSDRKASTFRLTTRLSEGTPRRRSGRWACATRGDSASTTPMGRHGRVPHRGRRRERRRGAQLPAAGPPRTQLRLA